MRPQIIFSIFSALALAAPVNLGARDASAAPNPDPKAQGYGRFVTPKLVEDHQTHFHTAMPITLHLPEDMGPMVITPLRRPPPPPPAANPYGSYSPYGSYGNYKKKRNGS